MLPCLVIASMRIQVSCSLERGMKLSSVSAPLFAMIPLARRRRSDAESKPEPLTGQTLSRFSTLFLVRQRPSRI